MYKKAINYRATIDQVIESFSFSQVIGLAAVDQRSHFSASIDKTAQRIICYFHLTRTRFYKKTVKYISM
jgi:hypothetical protein